MEKKPTYEDLKEMLANLEAGIDERLDDVRADAERLMKENKELRKQNDKMYNLRDVTVDCRNNDIRYTSFHTEEGKGVHMIVFDTFTIKLTEEQWERIVY